MTTELELQNGVLTSKILELQSALLFTESASLVKLPTHVITDIEIDADGKIWFVIPKPQQAIEAFDKEIPAKLDFFKKGKDFFVKVKGIAVIITDNAEILNNPYLSEEMKERMMDRKVIAMKVDVQEMDLIENSPKPAHSWIQSSRSQLSSWFF